MEIVLLSPKIPQNVGAIGRLCAATNTALHVVRPIPFQLDDRSLRRSGMDYWDHVALTVHTDYTAWRGSRATGRDWLLTTRGGTSLWDVAFEPGDALVFGSEDHGVSDAVRNDFGPERAVRIPQMNPEARSLNLSMAACIALYEALRQTRE